MKGLLLCLLYPDCVLLCPFPGKASCSCSCISRIHRYHAESEIPKSLATCAALFPLLFTNWTAFRFNLAVIVRCLLAIVILSLRYVYHLALSHLHFFGGIPHFISFSNCEMWAKREHSAVSTLKVCAASCCLQYWLKESRQ